MPRPSKVGGLYSGGAIAGPGVTVALAGGNPAAPVPVWLGGLERVLPLLVARPPAAEAEAWLATSANRARKSRSLIR